MQSKLKPLGQGSSPRRGSISDAELSRITGIPKPTIISWFKTDTKNWRNQHYWFLKSFSKEELKIQIEKSKDLTSLH